MCSCAVVLQSLRHVWLFATPGIIEHQVPLSPTMSWSLLKFMCIASAMLSNHLILWHPVSFCLQSFPGSVPGSRLLASGGQSIGASASAAVLEMNIQDWFPLGLTGLMTLLSKGRSRVFSSTTTQKHQFFGTQITIWHGLESFHPDHFPLNGSHWFMFIFLRAIPELCACRGWMSEMPTEDPSRGAE